MTLGRTGVVLLVVSLAVPGAMAADVQVVLSSEDGAHKLSPGEPIGLRAGDARGRNVISVDPETTHQTMLGMGASWDHATCYNLSLLSEEQRAAVITRLVHPDKGIGMNLMRLCIGTSDFVGEPYYSYDDMPDGKTDPELKHFSIEKDRDYVLPVVKAALRINPDLLYFASPWSPPGWMTTNGSMMGGKLKREYYAVYARYLLKFLRAYAEEGVPVHAMTLQNEPRMVSPDYPTCLWKGEDQRDFIRDHVGPLFEAGNVDTRIWCWDHNYNWLKFPRTVLSAPEAASYVEGTAFHFYEGEVEAMAEFKQEFPEKDLFFTEGSAFWTRGAIQIMGILRNGARSYNAWVVLLDENRKPNRGPHFASPTSIVINSETLEITYRFDYYMYGQFMKYIERGAVRLASTVGGRLFDTTVFRNPGGELVLVAANAEPREKRFTVQCGAYHFRAEVPGKAVVTYCWHLPEE